MESAVSEYEKTSAADAIQRVRRLEPTAKDSQSLDRWLGQLTGELAAAQKATRLFTSKRNQELLGQVFASYSSTPTALGVKPDRPSAPGTRQGTSPAKGTDGQQAVIQAGVAKASEIVLQLEDGQAAARLRDGIASIGKAASHAEARTRLTLVLGELERGLEGQRRQQRADAKRLALMQSFAHVNGSEADALRDALDSVADENALAEHEPQIAALLGADAQRLDTSFVRRQIAEILLEELPGYSLYEGGSLFIDEAAGVEGIVVDNDSLPDHVLHIRIDPGRSIIKANLEAKTARGENRTVAHQAEEGFCDDIGEVFAHLEARGVAAELIFSRGPGEVPMARLEQADEVQSDGARPQRRGRQAAAGSASQASRGARGGQP
jgi:hypothetical protein